MWEKLMHYACTHCRNHQVPLHFNSPDQSCSPGLAVLDPQKAMRESLHLFDYWVLGLLQTNHGWQFIHKMRVSSLVWLEDNKFFCLVPERLLQGKAIGNAWGENYVFPYIEIHISTCVRVYTQISTWKERHIILITFSARKKRETFHFPPWVQGESVCLHGQHAASWCKANTFLPFCRAPSPRLILTLLTHAIIFNDTSNTEIFCSSVQHYSKWIWGKLSFHSLAINITKFFWWVENFLPFISSPSGQFWDWPKRINFDFSRKLVLFGVYLHLFLNSKLSLTSKKTTCNPPLRVAG